MTKKFYQPPKRPPVENPDALKSLLLQKDRQIMGLVGKLETQRRIAERGLRWAQAKGLKCQRSQEDYIDLFQHMLDELTRSEV